jgi:hypothetical protein
LVPPYIEEEVGQVMGDIQRDSNTDKLERPCSRSSPNRKSSSPTLMPEIGSPPKFTNRIVAKSNVIHVPALRADPNGKPETPLSKKMWRLRASSLDEPNVTSLWGLDDIKDEINQARYTRK